jgi:hypothetical protein
MAVAGARPAVAISPVVRTGDGVQTRWLGKRFGDIA